MILTDSRLYEASRQGNALLAQYVDGRFVRYVTVPRRRLGGNVPPCANCERLQLRLAATQARIDANWKAVAP